MEAFLSSLVLVFAGEIGDKTQLLSLVLAARYKKPWTILFGVFIASVLNHALASGLGAYASRYVEGETLKWGLAVIFFAFAIWILVPDKETELKTTGHLGVLMTTIVTFFLCEMGDKTQLATVALAARYKSVFSVTLGSTLGMLGANGLAVFLGNKILKRLSMKWVRAFASLLFFISGLWILFSFH